MLKRMIPSFNNTHHFIYSTKEFNYLILNSLKEDAHLKALWEYSDRVGLYVYNFYFSELYYPTIMVMDEDRWPLIEDDDLFGNWHRDFRFTIHNRNSEVGFRIIKYFEYAVHKHFNVNLITAFSQLIGAVECPFPMDYTDAYADRTYGELIHIDAYHLMIRYGIC